MTLIDKAKDVVNEKLKTNLFIDLVGIKQLEIPVRLKKDLTVPSQIDIYVSLDKDRRGLHMSRLYLSLHDFFSKNTLSFSNLKKILLKVVKDQEIQKQKGKIRVSAKWPVKRKALKSSSEGWRYYPVFFEVNYDKSREKNPFEEILGGEVLYSSTCPCSASLSREVIRNNFEKTFPKKTISKKEFLDFLKEENFLAAVPHGQRSRAFFKVLLDGKKPVDFVKIVNQIEDCLKTPVQTAVKRVDEAQFAILNAENLMFCEDAVRRLGFLFKKSSFLDYSVRVSHYESLHPFTVESALVKGVHGGWRA